jgi:hypothetical protein
LSHHSYDELLRTAVVVYLALLPIMQWLVFRGLYTRGTIESVRLSRNVRDHVLATLLRAGLVSLIVAVPVFGVWAATVWSRLRWDILVGGEIILVFVILALGFTSALVRFSLNLMNRVRPEAAPRSLHSLRLAVLLTGGAYGAALWIYTPGTPGEMLLAVFVLGAALFALGLNRTAEMDPDLLARLAEAMKRR